jgi:hypothetical protein
MTTLKQFHWFWAWDDDKEEAWLREMAQKGWHFKSVTMPGYYQFEQGEPRNDFYRLDFFINAKAKSDYVQLFSDSGWEYLGEMGSWQYFRKTATENETLEIYSDNESKSKKYQRILLFLVVFLPIYINTINILNKRQDTLSLILTFVMFLFMILYGYGIIRLGMRMNQLKKKL